MFTRPGFICLPSLLSLPDLHNDPSQIIQGGVPGEHYHISGDLYNYLIQLAKKTAYSEPVMTRAGEIVTIDSGDIVMVLLNQTPNFIPEDTVSPPLPVPPPDPGIDPYLSYVVFNVPMDEAAGILIHVNYATAFIWYPVFAGSISASTNLVQLFGKNTVLASSSGAFLIIRGDTPSGGGGFITTSPQLIADFTWEIALRPSSLLGSIGITVGGATQHGFTAIGTNIYLDGVLNSYPAGINLDQWYHVCIERKGTTMKFFIDGVVINTLSSIAGTLDGAGALSNYYANARLTLGKARYNLTSFAPPANSYPR